MDFPHHKGMLLLDPDRPAGMFIVYVPDGATSAGTTAKIRETITSMFSSVTKKVSPWTSSSVPDENARFGETAELALASGEAADVQMLTVALPNGSHPV